MGDKWYVYESGGSIRPQFLVVIPLLSTKKDEKVPPDLAMRTWSLQKAPETSSAYVCAVSLSNIVRGEPFVLESPKKTRAAAIFLLMIEWWLN